MDGVTDDVASVPHSAPIRPPSDNLSLRSVRAEERRTLQHALTRILESTRTCLIADPGTKPKNTEHHSKAIVFARTLGCS
ncbi:hypothetical protein, partial [Bacillus sp. SIMBA_033]|uniref:hypothetical protein n=1 Tax=Bacillus sp. SIMBA_033 TaxID=3085776 RepID=UPI003979F736